MPEYRHAGYPVNGQANHGVASGDHRHHFIIGKQPLYTALNAIAEQSGMQLVYSDDMVNGVSAPSVIGQLSTEEALHKVLAGSGLGYRISSGNTITLAANTVDAPPSSPKAPSVNTSESVTLPPVKVIGEEAEPVRILRIALTILKLEGC